MPDEKVTLDELLEVGEGIIVRSSANAASPIGRFSGCMAWPIRPSLRAKAGSRRFKTSLMRRLWR
jgi:hypothetical protein